MSFVKSDLAISHYNLIKSQPDSRDWKFESISQPPQNLPSEVDLRSTCPPIVNQGPIGSCTGNAIAGAYAFDMIKQGLGTFSPSRLFIYYNERLLEGTVAQDAGADLRDGIKTICTNGVCDESIWPYDVNQFTTKPSPSAYQEALSHVAVSYYGVNTDAQSLKQALAQGFPVIMGIAIYESFESEATARSGHVPMPGPSERCLGGHAVCAVGYSDTEQHFIFRNSWGTEWGVNGYFYLPYDYARFMQDAWVITSVR